MAKKISIMEDDLLNEHDGLFEVLSSSKAPSWWNEIRTDPNLYIEIRKGNKIDVYYFGGRMAELKYNNFSKQITATAHPKYLGHEDNGDFTYYRLNSKGNYDAIYQDVLEYLENEKGRNFLKNNIEKFYSPNEIPSKKSEKRMQGDLRIDLKNGYIDTEFAHRFYDGTRETIRFDLVKIVNNTVIIVELKRIADDRLNTTKGNPEVITQLNNYSEFIKVNKDAILKYYKKLIIIKQKIALPLPTNINLNSLQLDITPKLLIVNNYGCNLSEGKKRRIQEIKSHLKGYEYTIVEI